jgi:TrmH family RNA methyltransferase
MTEYIESSGNEFIKWVASLKQKKYRNKSGCFIAEGTRLVKEAIVSGWDIEACIYTKEAIDHKDMKKFLLILQKRGCRLAGVSSAVYNKITDTEHGQGIMVIVRRKQYELVDLIQERPQGNRIIVVLDGLQDPGNAGTIIRTADASGSAGVILTHGSVDLFSGKTIRATMGSVFHIPIVDNVTSTQVIDFFRSREIKLMATALDASEIYYKTEFRENVAVVFGNEGKGVGRELLESSEKRLYIPIYGQAESLNVAISAAVILYEASRQCHVK